MDMNEFLCALYAMAADPSIPCSQLRHEIKGRLKPFYDGDNVVTHHGVWSVDDLPESLTDGQRRSVLSKLRSADLDDADWDRIKVISWLVQNESGSSGNDWH